MFWCSHHCFRAGSTRAPLFWLPALLILFFPVFVAAQSGSAASGNGGTSMIQGKIFFPSGRRVEGSVQIKLQSYTSGELATMTDSSGSFSFPSLLPGSYTVIVNAGDDYEIARESVVIDGDSNMSRANMPTIPISRRYTVMISLQEKAAANHAKASVISVELAKVPEDARSFYEKALDQEKAGQVSKAIENLKNALSIYPDFPLALNELGVQYLKIAQPSKALDPLRSATRLTPDAFIPKLNLGIALLEVQQFAEAEIQLRNALKVSSTATGHMYLGLTLTHLHNDDEAEAELKRAIGMGGDQLGQAHKYLGGLYWRKHQYRAAADELETYLRLTPKAADAEKIRSTIKELRTQS